MLDNIGQYIVHKINETKKIQDAALLMMEPDEIESMNKRRQTMKDKKSPSYSSLSLGKSGGLSARVGLTPRPQLSDRKVTEKLANSYK